MRAWLTGIDHVVIVVRDLQRAANTYARLGFTLTPRGEHTLGSQNHCIMFGEDYVELLGVPKPHPALDHYREFLLRGEGLAALALATKDMVKAGAELAACGIATGPPLEFSRPVWHRDGDEAARFGILQLPLAVTPGARAFVCQHFTPELVWQPQWQAHAVGARGIAAIAVAVEDVEAAASDYARLFAEKPQRTQEGLLINTGTAPMALCARGDLGRRLAGVGLPARARPVAAALFVRVADREQAARTLKRNGIDAVKLNDGALGVSAQQAHGVALVFG
jgi:catechol 2,3-dioxygenase-like lactoylglutathione lyase family enzyme